MMRDILEKLNALTEAKVEPGERKGISFKLKKLDKMLYQLNDYKGSMSHLKSSASALPNELKAELQQLQDKLNAEIEKVNTAYQIEYNRATVNDRPVKMDNLFKALAKHCKEIIKVYKELNKNTFNKQKFLYRGIRASDDALYGKPFEARKPKDSNADLHELVNGTIKDLGLEANRENAMFVTGDRGQAGGYGNSLYVMFPVDGFKFTWSKTTKDLVLDTAKKISMVDKNIISQIRSEIKKAKNASANPETFPIRDPDELFYSGYDYDSNIASIKLAVENGQVPENVGELLNELLTTNSIQAHFEFTDKDLFDAIVSEKEIYIKSPYYAVNVNHMDQLIDFLKSVDTDSVELPENFGEVPDILDQGDIVMITGGTHKGNIATVTYVYQDSVDVFVDARNSDVNVSRDRVELYKLPDGSIPMFEVGEKIIVTDPTSSQYGLVTVIETNLYNGKVQYRDADGNLYADYKNQIGKYTPELEQEILADKETRPPVLKVNDDVVVKDEDSEYYGKRGKVNYIYGTGKTEVYFADTSDCIDFMPEQLVLTKNAPEGLVKKEKGKYHLGDKIRITSGEYSNYVGTVVYIYSQGNKLEIDLTGLDKKVDVWVDDVEHYDEEPQQPKPAKPAPATEPSTMQIGDRVKILAGPKKGYTGVVTFVYQTVPEVAVKLQDEVMSQDFELKAIEKVGSTKPSAPVKIGDMVKVINPESSFHNQIGEVIEVEQTPDGKGTVKITNDYYKNGVKTFIDWIKKVDTPAFKVGDNVQILTGSQTGDTGIITLQHGTSNVYDVKNLSSGIESEFTANELKKVDKAPDVDYALGDVVVITDKSREDFGAMYSINYIYPSGTLGVENDSGQGGIVKPSQIKKYSMTSKIDDIDNLTWEPEPEVNAPAQTATHGFKDNDRVEVTGMFPSLIGMKGTVLQSSPGYIFVSVKLDGNDQPSSFPAQALKKITEQPAQEQEFHIGDTVEVVNPDLTTYGIKGKVTDMDVTMLVIQDNTTKDVAFVKKSSVKKIG